MLFTIIVLIILALIVGIKTEVESGLAFAFIMLCSLGAGLMCIILPCMYIETCSIKSQRDSVQQSIDTIRETGDQLEKAAVISDIIEINKNIQVNQDWNKNWFFDSAISDEVDNLELVK